MSIYQSRYDEVMNTRDPSVQQHSPRISQEYSTVLYCISLFFSPPQGADRCGTPETGCMRSGNNTVMTVAEQNRMAETVGGSIPISLQRSPQSPLSMMDLMTLGKNQ